MISDDLRHDIEVLPWRGPLVPVDTDGPESKLPVRGRLVRTQVFDLQDPTQVIWYDQVLNREVRGLAEIMQQQVTTTPGGDFRVLVVWAELYMCSPDYAPAEARPELVNSSRAEPVFAATARAEDKDIDRQVKDWLGELKARTDQKQSAAEPPAQADEPTALTPLPYDESTDPSDAPKPTDEVSHADPT